MQLNSCCDNNLDVFRDIIDQCLKHVTFLVISHVGTKKRFSNNDMSMFGKYSGHFSLDILRIAFT